MFQSAELPRFRFARLTAAVPLSLTTLAGLSRPWMASAKGPDVDRRDAAMARLVELMSILDAALEGRTHLVGNRLTVADFAVAGDFTHARDAVFPLAEFPNVGRSLGTIEAVPAWAGTAPPQVG